MKKLLVITVALVAMLTVPVYALLDDNSEQQQQAAIAAQAQQQGIDSEIDSRNYNTNLNNADSKSKSAAGAAAVQGQLGIVGTAVSTPVSTDVSIHEEGDDIKVYGNTWPVTPSTAGKEEKSLSSIFGGFGWNKTEEQIRLVEQIKVTEQMKAASLISKEEYEVDMIAAYEQLKHSNKNQKWLGVLPIATRGCNVLNLCGLLNW